MLMWSHYANEHAGFCLEFRHETELTFPFFLDQVNFRQKSLKEKAKYMLFFVTEVVQLRTDGMEPSIIVERLADQGIGFEPLTIGETVEDIKRYFDGQKHDPRTPDVLLGAVPIQDDRIQSRTIRIGQHDRDTRAHAPDSHTPDRGGIPHRTEASELTH